MKSSDDVDLSVGELAARFQIATHVLRHWEDVGLLTPRRDGAGRRRYGRADVFRVATIVRSKAAGMTLEQIQVLLDAEAQDRHQVLTAHVDELDRRMAEMERSREMTLHALACRAHDVAACPHFRSFVDDLVDGTVQGFPVYATSHPPRAHAHGTVGAGPVGAG